jgi:hypothetical protein
MNEFYKSKAALPRQARNAETLAEALLAWSEFRLENVVNACENLDDKYRKEFGAYHKIFSNNVALIAEYELTEIKAKANDMLTSMKADFSENHGGARRDAFGLCGAELEMILEKF